MVQDGEPHPGGSGRSSRQEAQDRLERRRKQKRESARKMRGSQKQSLLKEKAVSCLLIFFLSFFLSLSIARRGTSCTSDERGALLCCARNVSIERVLQRKLLFPKGRKVSIELVPQSKLLSSLKRPQGLHRACRSEKAAVLPRAARSP